MEKWGGLCITVGSILGNCVHGAQYFNLRLSLERNGCLNSFKLVSFAFGLIYTGM